MKWIGLYNKLGKQLIRNLNKSDVVAIIDGEEKPLLLKFKENGTPYLMLKEEVNYKECEKCSNYNIGDGYEDISKCRKCKFYNK